MGTVFCCVGIHSEGPCLFVYIKCTALTVNKEGDLFAKNGGAPYSFMAIDSRKIPPATKRNTGRPSFSVSLL